MNRKQLAKTFDNMIEIVLYMYKTLIDVVRNNNIPTDLSEDLLNYVDEMLKDMLLVPDGLDFKDGEYRHYNGLLLSTASKNHPNYSDTLLAISAEDLLFIDNIDDVLERGSVAVDCDTDYACESEKIKFKYESRMCCIDSAISTAMTLPESTECILSTYHICMRIISIIFSCITLILGSPKDYKDLIGYKVSLGLIIQRFSKLVEHNVFNDTCEFSWSINHKVIDDKRTMFSARFNSINVL